VGAKAHALRASSHWSAFLLSKEDIIMTMTNFRRAERAAKLFDRYALGEYAERYDLASLVLVNLLIDLMHFAERQTIDFGLCFDHAQAEYDAQGGGEPPC